MDFFTRPPHPITPKIKAPQNHLQLHFEIFQKSILKTYVRNAILVMHVILQRECCKSNSNEFSILCVETQVLWTEIFFLTYTKNIKIQFATQKMLLKVWIIN